MKRVSFKCDVVIIFGKGERGGGVGEFGPPLGQPNEELLEYSRIYMPYDLDRVGK